MKNKRLTHSGLILAVFLSVNGFARADEKAVPAAAEIKISFKVDPRLTQSLYMGERWVSPPTYTSAQDTVEARASGVDARGRAASIRPTWTPSDPEMVTVSPSQGNQVKINVKRAGQSRLRVTADGVSKELAIKAVPQGDAIQVEIAQLATELPTATAQDPPALKSQKDKLSYAVGMSVGTALRKQGVALQADPGLLLQGLSDVLSGSKTLLTDAEAHALVSSLQDELRSKQAGFQAEKNRKDGEAFLAANKDKEGVVTLASGLQYKILKAGDGQKPTADDAVVCHYRGTLINGNEFDSSYKRNQPATFALKNVIKGWTEALPLMPVGSRWQLFVPSSLGYGAHGARGIGPNATLIFEVELISIPGKS